MSQNIQNRLQMLLQLYSLCAGDGMNQLSSVIKPLHVLFESPD